MICIKLIDDTSGTADATCAIQISSPNRDEIDRETASKFKEAASTIVNECVMKQGMGGLIKGLGQNKTILRRPRSSI